MSGPPRASSTINISARQRRSRPTPAVSSTLSRSRQSTSSVLSSSSAQHHYNQSSDTMTGVENSTSTETISTSTSTSEMAETTSTPPTEIVPAAAAAAPLTCDCLCYCTVTHGPDDVIIPGAAVSCEVCFGSAAASCKAAYSVQTHCRLKYIPPILTISLTDPKPTDEIITRPLYCLICIDLPEVPEDERALETYQCVKGHTYCSKHVDQMLQIERQKCIVKNTNYTGSFKCVSNCGSSVNKAIPNPLCNHYLTEVVNIECDHCKQTIRFKNKVSHEDTCEYKIVPCSYDVYECSWKGYRCEAARHETHCRKYKSLTKRGRANKAISLRTLFFKSNEVNKKLKENFRQVVEELTKSRLLKTDLELKFLNQRSEIQRLQRALDYNSDRRARDDAERDRVAVRNIIDQTRPRPLPHWSAAPRRLRPTGPVVYSPTSPTYSPASPNYLHDDDDDDNDDEVDEEDNVEMQTAIEAQITSAVIAAGEREVHFGGVPNVPAPPTIDLTE